MRVVIFGPRGSGKTSAGTRLAARRESHFLDTDAAIVGRENRSVREIFASDGEPAFRLIEADVIRAALESSIDVIALGGGAVVTPVTRERLLATAALRIYLRCDVDELARRIDADPRTADQRPRLTGATTTKEEVAALLAVREPLYRAVATHEIDVTHASPDDVAGQIALLAEQTGSFPT